MAIERNFNDLIVMSDEEFIQCMKNIQNKLAVDKAYRDSFLQNPRQSLLDAGVPLEDHTEVKVVGSEEEANTLPAHVLPLVLQEKMPLARAELEIIAGGRSVFDQDDFISRHLRRYKNKA